MMEGGNSTLQNMPDSQPLDYEVETRSNLQYEIEVLREEREKSISDLNFLDACITNNSIPVHDLDINLRPVINNQRKANCSFERAIRKLIKYRRVMRYYPTRGNYGPGAAVAAAGAVGAAVALSQPPLPPPPPPPPSPLPPQTPGEAVVGAIGDSHNSEVFMN